MTQIKEIGKRELLNKLFEGTGYTNIAAGTMVQSVAPAAGQPAAATGQPTAAAGQPAAAAGGSVGFVTPSGRQDTMVDSFLWLEAIDFNLVYTPLKHLGYKIVLNAVGRLFAKCSQLKGLQFTIGLSARFSVENIQELWSGVVTAAKEYGAEQLSLELNSSLTGISIAVASMGVQKQSVMEKIPPVAKNHLICITGDLGAAYLGLHVLERERVAFEKIPQSEIAKYKQPDLSKYKYILSQYLGPHFSPTLLQQWKEAKIYPSSGYFITRGLAYTVKRLCEESGLGAKIFITKIPIASKTFEAAEEFGIDATTSALNGVDDYKFLFTIPLEKHDELKREFPAYDIIGHLCAPEAGQTIITPDGASLEIKAQE